MTPSYYANAAKERGLELITWTLERAGPGLTGYYYESTDGVVDLAEGDRFTLLHVLHEEVGILGIFSDWPATATFYANCVGLKLRQTAGGAAPPEEDPEVVIAQNGNSGASDTWKLVAFAISLPLAIAVTLQ
jgi:hypothetical protein